MMMNEHTRDAKGCFSLRGYTTNVQKVFSGFMDWLPKGIEGMGNLIEDAATGYYKLKDFLGSDELKPMREGLARFADNLGNVDWGRAIQGATDLANSFGDFLGNVDLQDTADTIGEIAGGLSNIVDFIDGIGAKNAILAGIGAYIAGGILAAFGKSFAAALGGKIAGALLGGAVVDAIETLADTATDILGNAIGNGIGSLIGNLAGSLLADLLMPNFNNDIDIDNINLPDDMPEIDLPANITSVNVSADIPPVQIQAELTGLTGLPTDGNGINIPVTYQDPGFAPAAATLSVPVVYADPGFAPAAVTVPIVWGPLPAIPTPPPVTVPVKVDTAGIAGQISGISVPPVEIPVTVNMQQNGRTMWDFASEFLGKANAQLEAIVSFSYEEPEPPQVPPIEVKVTYSTEGMPSMPTPPPMQVPVTYQVAPLNIPQPPPMNVPVSFQIAPINIPAPPAVQVQVTSNVSQVIGQLNSIPKALSSTHTVNSNVDAVRGQISSLNGLNTSSTHTINVVQTGAPMPGQGEEVPR